MKWDNLNEKSDWLFRHILNGKEQSPCENTRMEDIAQKLSDREHLQHKIDEQERFDYLKAYRKNIAPVKAVRRTSYLKIGIAATVLLLLCSGIFLYTLQQRDKEEHFYKILLSNIHPGKQQALLITHNGERIELNRNTRQTIRQENGTSIQIDTTGLLYHTDNSNIPATLRDTLIIPRGGEFTLTLSDGTKIWLNSDSRLTYPVHFNDSIREVTISGEAYFSVAHSTIPFLVKTSRGDITVLGTEFNVNSYPESNESVTTLVNGKIAYLAPDGEKFVLVPEQQIIIKQDGQKIIQDVDPRYAASWKDGMFLFKEMRLEDIMKQLERWYDIHTLYSDEEVKDLHFSGDLSRFKNIDTFIKMFEESSDVRIKVEGKNLSIR